VPEPTTVVALPDGRVLAADDVGDPHGWPIVSVHGTPDSRLARHPDDGLAAFLGVRLVAVDRPGFGHSTPDPTGTVGSFGRDVVALLDHLGIRRASVLAWSAGALPALAVAAGAPDRITRVGIAAGLPPFAAYAEPGVLEGADAGRQMLAEIGAEIGPTETAAELAPYLVPQPITLVLAREHLLEGADRALDVVQLFESEQTDAEGLEISRLVALQRHSGGDLQAMVGKFLAALDVGIIGVAHHYARGLKAGGGHAFEAFAGQHGAHPIAQNLLFAADLVETVGLRLFHHFVKSRQGIAGHGRMVGMPALFVGLHDLQPLFQVAGEAAALRLLDALEGQGTEHYQGAAR